MRMTLWFMPLLLLVSLHATAQSNVRPVDAKLSLPFQTVLPGVPFDLTVKITNNSNATVACGVYARLHVVLPGGAVVSPSHGVLLEPRVSSNSPNWIELSPGQIRELSISWRYSIPAQREWSAFSGPGTYGISLDLEGSMTPDDYVGKITTNSARLVRTVPVGEDEALWKEMASASEGWADNSFVMTTRGRQILRELLAAHPTSQYYPYAILLDPQIRVLEHSVRKANDDDINRVRATSERFRESPAYPHLLLFAGDLAASVGVTAYSEQNWRTAAKYLRLADDYYGEALKNAPGAATTPFAEESRAHVRGQLNRDELRPFRKE